MKLEVGMYVRTKKGIERIKLIEENFMERNNTFIATDNNEWRGAYNGKFNGFTIRNNVIAKASHNIIDLIEVGDYVNGTIVTTKTPNKYIELDYSYNRKGCYEEDIKTVVTKEQFEAIKYEIK